MPSSGWLFSSIRRGTLPIHAAISQASIVPIWQYQLLDGSTDPTTPPACSVLPDSRFYLILTAMKGDVRWAHKVPNFVDDVPIPRQPYDTMLAMTLSRHVHAPRPPHTWGLEAWGNPGARATRPSCSALRLLSVEAPLMHITQGCGI